MHELKQLVTALDNWMHLHSLAKGAEEPVVKKAFTELKAAHAAAKQVLNGNARR